MKKTVLLMIAVTTTIISACGGSSESEAPQKSYSISVSDSSSGTVTFAVFGNTGYATDNGKTFENLIRAVNEYDVDFSVNLGNRLPDGVPPHGAGALRESADESLQLFDAPVYPVAGRNDVFDYESDVEYTKRYGPMWYSFRRENTQFIVLNTEDDAYRFRFGNKPRIGDEQLEWLWNCLKESEGKESPVLFMNRPLWVDSPSLWSERLLPILKAGNVNLIVTSFKNGLFDWGNIDGIRAVSTGCAGPMESKKTGLFPHFLLITVNGDKSVFRVLFPDGTNREGIRINSNKIDTIARISAPFNLQPFKTDASWNVSEELNFRFKNSFDTTISGKLDFTIFPTTSWNIEPSTVNFSIEPGVSKTLHLGIRGSTPQLGPVPEYSAEIRSGETAVYNFKSSLKMKIPHPRTGEVISVSAKIADTIPYSFDDKSLRIPVDIESVDTCGRLIIYSENESGIPVCLHLSPLRDFELGLNEFLWNGRDLEGERVTPGTLSYKICIYNKKAPVTWVAGGPPNNNGTFSVERTLSGLIAKTHNQESILSYRIGESIGVPKSAELFSPGDFLDGLSLSGFAQGENDRIYLSTDAGIVCVYFTKGKVTPDISFGENGYIRFTDYRGRLIGSPSYHNGLVYVGIGGSGGSSPAIVILDGESGEELSFIDLGDFFSEYSNPPSICVTDRGIYCAHPDDDDVIMLAHYGDVLWVNKAGDMIGDKDNDGRSFTWCIATDRYGFSYVNTPGYSARCGVLGPDGRGLFRVILVQLPGLRVSSVVPMIEGKSTDGLYFVTRGGDIPYVFHVPFTIKAGKIVDETELVRE